MSEPTLKFIYNKSTNDTAFNRYLPSDPNYGVLNTSVDTIVFTGGGIDDVDKNMGDLTLASGTRSATIRPSATSYIIPYTYVESGAWMYRVPLAGQQYLGQPRRYVFGVSISGTMNSDLYLEAWDDNSFSTYNLPVLSGTSNSSNNSYVNAIRTTDATPPGGWTGGNAVGAYLRGQSNRVGLSGGSSLTDEEVYFNIFIQLETDTVTFHNTPVLTFRYLYT